MTTRRKPIFARNKRNVSQPHWLWVALSLCVLIAVTLFDVGQLRITRGVPGELIRAASEEQPIRELF